MDAFSTWNVEVARRLIEGLSGLEGATLPILHALQDEFGYVDKAAIPLIADALNVSRAEVHGAITFYHEFRDAPPQGRVIKLCRAEACQAVGCEDLVDHLRRRHGVTVDDRHAHSAIHVETVYCLGNCALGPAALVDGELIARLDVDRLSALCAGASAAELQAGRGHRS